MADSDQSGALVDQGGEGGGVELSGRVVGDDHDLGAGAPGDLEVGEHIAAVLGAAGEDAVARLEGQCVERGVPGVGGVVEQRDLVGPSAHQPGEVVVGGVDPLPFLIRGLVAADGRFEFQVGGHGVQGPPGEEGRSGVVEVHAVRGARCVPAQCVDVHAHTLPTRQRWVNWARPGWSTFGVMVMPVSVRAWPWMSVTRMSEPQPVPSAETK